MARRLAELPRWTWDEMEAALLRLSPTSRTDTVLEALLLEAQARQSELSPEDLLHELLCLGWLMAQAGVGATVPRQTASFASSSSPPSLS
ncbi:hypothetical protein [Brevundimonas aurifodinae]|uniref:Uncharacterized protein n=1 Tax=Brevundimonas aurifodinae TaxID=1508312 RepID=A0ABV1NKN2_9CAUL